MNLFHKQPKQDKSRVSGHDVREWYFCASGLTLLIGLIMMVCDGSHGTGKIVAVVGVDLLVVLPIFVYLLYLAFRLAFYIGLLLLAASLVVLRPFKRHWLVTFLVLLGVLAYVRRQDIVQLPVFRRGVSSTTKSSAPPEEILPPLPVRLWGRSK